MADSRPDPAIAAVGQRRDRAACGDRNLDAKGKSHRCIIAPVELSRLHTATGECGHAAVSCDANGLGHIF